LFVAVLFLAGQGGCALFPSVSDDPSNAFALRPIVQPRDGIRLEVWYVDRPAGDPLTGDALWREIDQINSIAPDVRFRLNEAGIRYGVTGSNLPETLSALLNDHEASAIQRTSRQHLPLLSGATGELEVASLPRQCRIRIPVRTSRETWEYSGVRCVFQVTAQRTQAGWVRMEFVPEIHHGESRIRPVATESDWQMQESQRVEPLYEQRFSVELNLGEHVIIGATDAGFDSVGQHFFRGGQPESGQERLIVLRVQGMEQVNPVPVRDWALPAF
jgi:hypothetical protein